MSAVKKKIIIGVTGRTKSGKSLACAYLAKAGCAVIDVDKFAHALYLKGRPLWKQLVKAYGEKILDTRGEVDRSKLREIVFRDKKKYGRFVNLVYPVLARGLRLAISNIPSSIVALDMAVLFESGFASEVDKIICIACDGKIWAKRLAMYPQKEFLLKAALYQEIFGEAKKIALSDYILYNNGSKEQLKKGILEALFLIKKELYGPAKKGKY
jgi:dephospho-CoA kinase